MSRIPLTFTGLAPLGPQTVDNPFVEGEEQESPALSIASYAQRAPREQQEALGRALYATTGLMPEPGSEKQRNQIRQMELLDRTRIARAAADPKNPISQEALNDIVQQHNQRWSVYGFLSSMPSPAALYSEAAAESDPLVRNQMISEGLKKYQETGEYNDDLSKVLLSENPQDRDYVNKRLTAIDKQKEDAARLDADRRKDIAETMGKMLEDGGDVDRMRTRYQAIRVRYPDLPPVTLEEPSMDDYRYALAGETLGLPARPINQRVAAQMAAPPQSPNFSQREEAIDTRRMTVAEKEALQEEVNTSGVKRLIIDRNGNKTFVIPRT